MPPHVRRGGTRGRSNTPRHAVQARAALSAGRSAPRTQGKFAAFDEFCNRLYVDVMPSSSSGGESKRQTRWSYCNGLNPQNFDPKIIKKYAFCNWRRFEVFIPMDSSHSWCTNKSLLERWFSNGTLRRVIVEKSVLDELESEAKSRGDLSNIREFPADRWKPLTKNMPPICIRTVDSDGNPIGSNGE